MDITATFVGNATTLITAGGLTLLTDPNFLHRGQWAYLGYGLVSKRLREPAVRVDELPPIDAIVLSHLHGDHWDRVAHRGLDHGLPVVTTPHAARRLQHRGFVHALGLPTWQHHVITKGAMTSTLTSLPGRHAPGMESAAATAGEGHHAGVRSDDGSPRRRLYISGDTLLIEELNEIPRRFDPIDLGLLHLGGTPAAGRPATSVRADRNHGRPPGCGPGGAPDPAEGDPIHFDDYGVFASPLADFTREMQRRGMTDRIIELSRCASVTV